jgi:carboxymethylenebutenolidase
MLLKRNSGSGICLILAAMALLLGACDTGDRTSAEPGQDAGTATPRAQTDVTARSGGAGSDTQLRAVVSERLPYAEVGEELVYGYFVFPSDMIEPLPAVVVIHEWWGLNDTVRSMADRLAAEGFIVLAVDLFAGKVASGPEAARQLMLNVVEKPDPASENIRQAYYFVKNTAGAPSVGVLGWGFGGVWALNAAMLLPDDLDAAVIYYGQVIGDEDRLRPVNAAILGFFGATDRGIPVDSVQQFEAALERLRKDYEVSVYSGVSHSFANPTHRNYNADVADLAWNKTLEFLRANLIADTE